MNQDGERSLMRLIAQMMDNAFRIPGTQYRFGLDPLLGLIPGFGDTATALVSAFTLMQAVRMGLPKVVVIRMGVNVLMNTVVGAIPVLGDAFSFWFKSNVRNVALMEKHMGHQRVSTWTDWAFVILILSVLLAVLVGSVAVIVYLINLMFSQPTAVIV